MNVRFCICSVLAGVLTGCVTAGRVPSPNSLDSLRIEAARAHTESARALEEGGELGSALEEWRIVRALQPNSAEAVARIRELEGRIADESAGLLTRARREASRGSLRSAQALTLAALALNPEDAGAQAYLRDLEAKRTRYRLATEPTDSTPKKSEDEYYGKLAEQEDVVEQSASVPLDVNRANQAYQRGLALFRSNKAEAAKAFDETLKYDPNHQKARTYRETLRRLGYE